MVGRQHLGTERVAERAGEPVGGQPENGTEDANVTPIVTQLTIMVDFMDSCRRATTIYEINLAAGVAREELLDLAEDCFDHLRVLFETPNRN
jgi:hypothetical protein